MPELITLLVLSFNQRNLELLTQVLEQANYQVVATSNYTELEQALSNSSKVDLGLIDLSGWDRVLILCNCKQHKRNYRRLYLKKKNSTSLNPALCLWYPMNFAILSIVFREWHKF